MHTAYLGESFELSFTMTDPSDADRTVDSASYRVIASDGETILQAGTMGIDADGHTLRFRFNATEIGTCTIEVTWSMGLDRWVQPFLMSVEAPVR